MTDPEADTAAQEREERRRILAEARCLTGRVAELLESLDAAHEQESKPRV